MFSLRSIRAARDGSALLVTLRLLATRGFPPSQAKPASAARRLGFCPRSGPSALLATAPRFYSNSIVKSSTLSDGFSARLTAYPSTLPRSATR